VPETKYLLREDSVAGGWVGLVTGTAKFTDDIFLKNMLDGKILLGHRTGSGFQRGGHRNHFT
jgi:hypothetical protein